MKKLLAALLTLALLTGLVSAPVSAAAAGEGSGKPAEWKRFNNQVTLRVPVYERNKEGYPPVEDNYWTRWVQREFGDAWNIKVEYVPILRGDVMTEYALLISAGQTPTIMMEYDYTKVAEWARTGAMRQLDLDQFRAWAPNYYQAMVSNNQLGYTDLDGKTYFALFERPYHDNMYTYATFVRKDWLDAVGKPLPTTYDEHAEAVDAIIAAGLTDIPPVALGKPSDAYARNFAFRDFPVKEEEWAMHSSLGTASLSWAPTKAMLQRYNEEYNKGWYAKDFEEHDSISYEWNNQNRTDFVNGKLYSFSGYVAPYMDWLQGFYENNPDAELAVLNPYATGVGNETQLRADNPFGMIVGFSSLATEDELHAAWMYMEWMMQPEVLFTLENGIEGKTFSFDANGLPVFDGDYRGEEMLNNSMNIDMTCVVHASKKVGDIEDVIAAISPKGLPKDFTSELIDQYYILKEIAAKGRTYPDPVFSVDINSEADYSWLLITLWHEYFTRLVKCSPGEFESLYGELSKQYLDAGYQKVIDERLGAYRAGNTTKLPGSAAGKENPSSWAQEAVSRAVSLKLVPESLQYSYTRPITRAEFCSLAVRLVETVTGKPITMRRIFTDTYDINVQKIGGLGIVAGVGDDRFDPSGTLKREQAAVILANTMEALGSPLAESAATFADKDSVASWALPAVGKVQAASIMSGTGDNNFSPGDSYTREQSIITMLKLYDLAN